MSVSSVTNQVYVSDVFVYVGVGLVACSAIGVVSTSFGIGGMSFIANYVNAKVINKIATEYNLAAHTVVLIHTITSLLISTVNIIALVSLGLIGPLGVGILTTIIAVSTIVRLYSASNLRWCTNP